MGSGTQAISWLWRARVHQHACGHRGIRPLWRPSRLAADEAGSPRTPSAQRRRRRGAGRIRPIPKLKQREERHRELQAIEQSIQQSDEERQRIEAEIASLKADREKLHQALVAAADKVRTLEERVSDAEDRLAKQVAQERASRPRSRAVAS